MGEATPAFFLDVPVYQDYNNPSTVCSFSGPGLFQGNLWCLFDDDCGDITIVADSPGYNWTISVVLLSCDQVQLQCGKINASGFMELSSPVDLSVLQSKAAVCGCVLQCMPLCSHTTAILKYFAGGNHRHAHLQTHIILTYYTLNDTH